MLIKEKTEKTRGFRQYLYCCNFKVRAMHKRQSDCAGRFIEEIRIDTERDNYMSAEEALED